jgi:uncharacterized membrane protein HdeD (DUF308 family)
MASETVNTTVTAPADDRTTQRWWSRLSEVNAGVAVAVGIVLLIWPHATLTVAAVILGVWLVFSALVQLWQAFLRPKGEDETSRAVNAIGGLFYLVAGIFCLRHPFGTLSVLAAILGVVWLVSGVAKLFVSGKSEPDELRRPQITTGIISILGGLCVLLWPSASLITLVRIAAIVLLVQGLMQMLTTLRTRASAGRTAPTVPTVPTASRQPRAAGL